MDRQAMLASFDEQLRCNPRPSDPRTIVEREAHLTRLIEPGGWAGILWCDLEGLVAEEVIAREIERFAEVPGEWEWKHYSYDAPAELPEHLIAAGFKPEQPETVLVADLAGQALGGELPEGVSIELLTDPSEVRSLLEMLDGVFGEGVRGLEQAMLEGIRREPPSTLAMAAMLEGVPIAGGRVELDGSEFAGLWGGATVPEWRHRGIFRALVARGAALAAQRGRRYGQVDALDTSRPILEGLGFIELAKTRPYTYAGATV